jgi:hypothetical protein
MVRPAEACAPQSSRCVRAARRAPPVLPADEIARPQRGGIYIYIHTYTIHIHIYVLTFASSAAFYSAASSAYFYFTSASALACLRYI